MTTPGYGFLESPRYQKAIQKLLRLQPEQKALFNTVIADETFGDEEMRHRLRLMDLESKKLARQRVVDLGEKQLKRSKSYTKYLKDIGQYAEEAEPLGWANIAVSGLRGIGDIITKKKKADFYRTLEKKYG